MEVITYSEMLDAMHARDRHNNPITFSLGFVKYNKQLKTGGDYVEYPSLTVSNVSSTFARQFKGITNPNHYKNATRNLLDTRTNQIIKVHLHLTFMFNGKEVIRNKY